MFCETARTTAVAPGPRPATDAGDGMVALAAADLTAAASAVETGLKPGPLAAADVTAAALADLPPPFQMDDKNTAPCYIEWAQRDPAGGWVESRQKRAHSHTHAIMGGGKSQLASQSSIAFSAA